MWRLVVDPRVEKATTRFPAHDRQRIIEAINAMAEDPFAGAIKRLGAGEYRRRTGSYRIFFDIRREDRVVSVTRVERRTSATY